MTCSKLMRVPAWAVLLCLGEGLRLFQCLIAEDHLSVRGGLGVGVAGTAAVELKGVGSSIPLPIWLCSGGGIRFSGLPSGCFGQCDRFQQLLLPYSLQKECWNFAVWL